MVWVSALGIGQTVGPLWQECLSCALSSKPAGHLSINDDWLGWHQKWAHEALSPKCEEVTLKQGSWVVLAIMQSSSHESQSSRNARNNSVRSENALGMGRTLCDCFFQSISGQATSLVSCLGRLALLQWPSEGHVSRTGQIHPHGIWYRVNP